ncbi:hypothetical protein AB0I02_23100 [Streptomyces phaeochromogenes]
MDDIHIFALLDELLLSLTEWETTPTDIDFTEEVHWLPVPRPDEMPTEISDALELSDVAPPGEAEFGEGVQWVGFPNPFLEGPAQDTGAP